MKTETGSTFKIYTAPELRSLIKSCIKVNSVKINKKYTGISISIRKTVNNLSNYDEFINYLKDNLPDFNIYIDQVRISHDLKKPVIHLSLNLLFDQYYSFQKVRWFSQNGNWSQETVDVRNEFIKITDKYQIKTGRNLHVNLIPEDTNL